MKTICLIGPVDKRAISYPLIKTLMHLGKTLVVTDDGVYRRFDTEYASRFSFENSDFIVTPVIDRTVQEEVNQIADLYETVLYITTNELPPNCDKVVYCRGVDRAILNLGVLDALEEKEFIEVYVTFSKLSDNTLLKIEPNKNTLAYIYECEDKKEFLPTKESAYSDMLSKFFESELDIPKNTIKGLLQRKG